MTVKRFITSEGVRGSTASARRYVVVDKHDAEVIYRTDDLSRARVRASRSFRLEVIDTQKAPAR